MKYLVTGGAGFIGSHLLEAITLNDDSVICIDDLSTGYLSNIVDNKNIKFINEKVEDTEIESISGIDGIFHLAAQASVPISIDNYYDSSSNNLMGMLKIWELGRKLNVPIIYASSSAVYGNLPIGDDTLGTYDLISPYALDKLTMENYAKLCWEIYGVPSVGLRFFNVYGPRQDPSSPYSGVISIFIDRLIKKEKVVVNGGYQKRDFIYVDDIVSTMKNCMDVLLHEPNMEVFNVGTGRSVTVDFLLDALSKILKVTPDVVLEELPEGDPENSSGTFEKLNNFLDLTNPRHINLEEGLRKTVDYLLKVNGR
mgnify:FL=1